jgi:hypothetical protein
VITRHRLIAIARLSERTHNLIRSFTIHCGKKGSFVVIGKVTNSILLGLLSLSAVTWQSDLYAETQLLLSPSKLKSRIGHTSEQQLSVLSVIDQQGTDDSWDAYKEFYTDSRGYSGEFTFNLPTETDPANIAELSFISNFKGPERSEQRWIWQIRDFKDGKWVIVADNSGVAPWRWSYITAPIDQSPERYVNHQKRLKLRYLTRSAVDNSDLDYLALNIQLDADTDPPTPPAPTPEPSEIWQPSPGTSWQIQLQGNIDTSFNVEMYDIDLFDMPQQTIDELHAQGKTVICYFSAGSWEAWRPDADQFSADIKGRSNGWPGEVWLDIRNLDQLGPIMQARLDMAVNKNCDGVDPDNVDGYTNNTGFPLSYQDQITFNSWLASEAHQRGLSIGLKNDLDQIEDLVNDFDWALNEQCFQYNECDLLLPFIQAGKAVFGIEYNGDTRQFCAQANRMGFDTLFKNLDLDAWRVDCKDY